MLRIEPLRVSPLRASSALPGTPPSQRHGGITCRHRFDKCPPEGGERRCRANGPRKGNQKVRPRKRARTVRGGTAFPPVALRLRLRTGLDPPCGPAAPRSALRRSAPPAGYPEKGCPSEVVIDRKASRWLRQGRGSDGRQPGQRPPPGTPERPRSADHAHRQGVARSMAKNAPSAGPESEPTNGVL